MVSQRHVGSRPEGHVPQVVGVQRSETGIIEEKKIRGREKTSGESPEASRGRIYKGGTIHDVVDKCSLGEEKQREVENMHKLHGLEQGMSKECLPAIKY